MDNLGYVNMGIDDKFNKFIATNYEPVKKQPAFDVKSEFIVQMIFSGETSAWYGPISFGDLTAFANALPPIEREVFIRHLKKEKEYKGGHNG